MPSLEAMVTDADRARAIKYTRIVRRLVRHEWVFVVELVAGPQSLRLEDCWETDGEAAQMQEMLVEAIALALAEQRERFEKPYMELIMAVSRKCPNESRHQTALRYIQSCETGGNERTATAAIRRGEP